MASDIVSLFKTYVSETLIYQTSELLGETKDSTGAAVNAIFPTLLGSLIMKGNTERGASEIIDYLAVNNINDVILHDLASILSGGPEVETIKANGATILKFLVDDKVSSMIDSTASDYGLRTSSASSLLKIVATVLMAIVSRVVKENRLNPSGLKNLLESSSDYVKENSPTRLGNIVGPLNSVLSGRTAHGKMDIPNNDTPDNRSLLSKLLPWIVLLIAALGLFYFLDKGTNAPAKQEQKPAKDSIENVQDIDTLQHQ